MQRLFTKIGSKEVDNSILFLHRFLLQPNFKNVVQIYKPEDSMHLQL